MGKTKSKKTVEGQHTTMPTISGFVFQYYVFILKLLTAQNGDEVSFELYDDVATKTRRATVLTQVKHTIKAAIDEEGVQLKNRAADMWKAIDVWLKLIMGITNDEITKNDQEQKDYIESHDFVLFVNKDFRENKIYKLSQEIQKKVPITDVYIDGILDGITSEAKPRKKKSKEIETKKTENTQTYIDRFKNFKYRSSFLSKLKFEEGNFDSIEKDCIRVLREDLMCTTDEKAKLTLDDIKKEIDKDLKKCAKSGVPLKYTYSDRHLRFAQVFENIRSTPINFRLEHLEYKKEFIDLVCIKQLMKAGDLSKSDTDNIAKRTNHFLSFKNTYDELVENHRITDSEDEAFREDAICFWENEFENQYGGTDSSTLPAELKRRAKHLLHEIRKYKVTLRNQLTIPISNGAFYYLSDECLLGWHRDWQKYFKKKR